MPKGNPGGYSSARKRKQPVRKRKPPKRRK
jgi:hypothetical protein